MCRSGTSQRLLDIVAVFVLIIIIIILLLLLLLLNINSLFITSIFVD